MRGGEGWRRETQKIRTQRHADTWGVDEPIGRSEMFRIRENRRVRQPLHHCNGGAFSSLALRSMR